MLDAKTVKLKDKLSLVARKTQPLSVGLFIDEGCGVVLQAERGMLLFERAISEHNPSVRCSQLEHCLLLAEQGVCLTNVAAHLRASIALLQTQTAIEAYDANPRHTADNEAFTRFPKRRGVPLTPAIATLYYGYSTSQ